VAAQRGSLPQAIQFYRQALADIEPAAGGGVPAVGADYGLDQRILCYNNLAYHLHLLGDPTAGWYAQQGMTLAQEKGVMGLQTYLNSTLGEIALAAGDLEAAEGYFKAGLALAEAFNVPERVAGITANLGLLAIQRGQTAAAIHHLSTALGLADALGTRHLAVRVRLWLAPLLPRSEALKRLAEARAMAEESGRQGLLEEAQQVEEKLG
jgi:tetratricopeptide (TPR) repeat protein